MKYNNMNDNIGIDQDIIFGIYKNNKKLVFDLRVWLVARGILDVTGVGRANISDICKIIKIREDYLRRTCNKSPFFRKLNKQDIYYVSDIKIKDKYSLWTKR